MTDMVNHPPHYARAATHPSGVECIEIVRDLPFCLGNAIKYLYRAEYKGSAAEDYRKAAWYLREYVRRPMVYPAVSRLCSDALSRWRDVDRGPICILSRATAFRLGVEDLGLVCIDAAGLCDRLAERAK